MRVYIPYILHTVVCNLLGSGPIFIGGKGGQRQRVHAGGEFLLQLLVDQALTSNAAETGKSG